LQPHGIRHEVTRAARWPRKPARSTGSSSGSRPSKSPTAPAGTILIGITRTSQARAHKESAALYAAPEGWARKAILNVACSGKLSSERMSKEYADETWSLHVSAER
jgi:hypothetical protein